MLLKSYLMLNLYLRELAERLEREEGQDLIEYALLVALISLAAVLAITAAGQEVNNIFNQVVAALQAAL